MVLARALGFRRQRMRRELSYLQHQRDDEQQTSRWGVTEATERHMERISDSAVEVKIGSDRQPDRG